MKNKEITASKKANGKIQYLTEILPEIPTNTILYKKLTGLGATWKIQCKLPPKTKRFCPLVLK